MHYFLETDLKEIDAVVESCERLFSSPIPPNMARHGVRAGRRGRRPYHSAP